MRIKQDEPFEQQPRANGAMASVLEQSTRALLALGIVAVLTPGRIGSVLAWVALGLVIAVPLLRTGWLGVRWIDRRDLLFSALAFGLLTLVAIGGVSAILLR